MLQVRGISKSYGREALFDGIDLDVAPGEWVAIVGESGSGKSTLLNAIAGIDRPDRGTVALGAYALDYGDDEALAAVGLAGFEDRKPGSLSGGEAQRAAIARAIAHRPRLLLADEPTGNLDEANAGIVLDTLARAVRDVNAAALMVTHSAVAASRADRVLRLSAGRLHPGP